MSMGDLCKIRAMHLAYQHGYQSYLIGISMFNTQGYLTANSVALT